MQVFRKRKNLKNFLRKQHLVDDLFDHNHDHDR